MILFVQFNWELNLMFYGSFFVTKAVFGSCKSISGKYSIFRKCYFPERKLFSCVWLHFKKFSEKYFLVFGEEKGKDKPRQTQKKEKTARSRSSRSTIMIDEQRDRQVRSLDDRTTRRTIAPLVDCSARQTIAPLIDRRSVLSDQGSLFSFSLSLSLSLSLFPEMI